MQYGDSKLILASISCSSMEECLAKCQKSAKRAIGDGCHPDDDGNQACNSVRFRSTRQPLPPIGKRALLRCHPDDPLYSGDELCYGRTRAPINPTRKPLRCHPDDPMFSGNAACYGTVTRKPSRPVNLRCHPDDPLFSGDKACYGITKAPVRPTRRPLRCHPDDPMFSGWHLCGGK